MPAIFPMPLRRISAKTNLGPHTISVCFSFSQGLPTQPRLTPVCSFSPQHPTRLEWRGMSDSHALHSLAFYSGDPG